MFFINILHSIFLHYYLRINMADKMYLLLSTGSLLANHGNGFTVEAVETSCLPLFLQTSFSWAIRKTEKFFTESRLNIIFQNCIQSL